MKFLTGWAFEIARNACTVPSPPPVAEVACVNGSSTVACTATGEAVAMTLFATVGVAANGVGATVAGHVGVGVDAAAAGDTVRRRAAVEAALAALGVAVREAAAGFTTAVELGVAIGVAVVAKKCVAVDGDAAVAPSAVVAVTAEMAGCFAVGVSTRFGLAAAAGLVAAMAKTHASWTAPLEADTANAGRGAIRWGGAPAPHRTGRRFLEAAGTAADITNSAEWGRTGPAGTATGRRLPEGAAASPCGGEGTTGAGSGRLSEDPTYGRVGGSTSTRGGRGKCGGACARSVQEVLRREDVEWQWQRLLVAIHDRTAPSVVGAQARTLPREACQRGRSRGGSRGRTFCLT